MEEKQTQKAVLVTALFTAGLLLCATLLLCAARLLQTRTPPVLGVPTLRMEALEAQEGLTTTEIVSKVLPSVVSIDLYEDDSLVPTGSGSGVVLSENGYIATNAHVVYGVSLIRVVLHNGQGYTAKPVGYDLKTDLAVVKISASGLAPASFADSGQVVVGQRVVAIGNSAGSLPGTSSQGIVSGVGRSMPLSTATGQVVRMTLLQTDAAINPGNSGGALANANGLLIGISIGKIEDSNVENIGFAIPSALALPILQRIMEEEEAATPAMLGVVVQELNETTGPARGLPGRGLYIEELLPQGSLPGQGVQVGDVLVRVNGAQLVTVLDLMEELENHAPGDTVLVEVYRAQSGAVEEFDAVLYGDGEEER